jgi:hypothetical protein
MTHFHEFLALLRYPYPYSGKNRGHLLSSSVASLIVLLFLLSFTPIDDGILPQLVTTLSVFIGINLTELLRRLVLTLLRFNDERWSLGHEFLLFPFLCFIIAAVGWFLLPQFTTYYFPLTFYLGFTFKIFLFLVMPVVVTISFLNKNQQEKQAQSAQNLIPVQGVSNLSPQQVNEIFLQGEGKDNVFRSSPDELIYITTADNYALIYYLNKGILKKQMLRRTLTNVENDLKDTPQYVRCHRAFIVNMDRVCGVEGNSKGKKLKIDVPDAVKIPVGRNYLEVIDQRLKEKQIFTEGVVASLNMQDALSQTT